MKLISLIVIAFSIFGSSAFASYQVINCDSIRGTNNSLILIVVNQDLKQVRVIGPGRQIALIPQKMLSQNIPNSTLYTLVGQSSFLQVENKVLENNGGLVKLSGDEFSCF